VNKLIYLFIKEIIICWPFNSYFWKN